MNQHPEDTPTEALLDGRYRLGECIGEGGMARVLRADDLILERTVAIKLLRPGADPAANPARVRTEMTVLAGLNHPSLVTLFDANVVPGGPDYLVMEFVDGPSLAERLAAAPVSSRELAGLVAELAEALHVVHSSGVVHRDVKPSNVLLAPTKAPGRQYRAKLADFGVAYLVDSTRLTTPGTVIGTGAYLAPEQVRGEAVTPAVDIYALGLMMLEALTGERAFPHATGIGAVLARLNSPPDIPSWLGPGWSELLRRMTATDPAARPGALDVADLVARLPEIVRPPDAPVVAPTLGGALEATQALPPLPVVPAAVAAGSSPASAWRRTDAPRRGRRRARRRRVWLTAGAAAFAGILLASAGLWALNGAGGTPLRETEAPLISEPTPESTTAVEPADVAPAQQEPVQQEPAQQEPAQQEPAQQEPVDAVVEQVSTGPGVSDRAQRDAERAAEEQRKAAEKAAKEEQKAAEKAQRDAEKAQRDADKAERPGGGPGGAP